MTIHFPYLIMVLGPDWILVIPNNSLFGMKIGHHSIALFSYPRKAVPVIDALFYSCLDIIDGKVSRKPKA